MSRTAPGLAQAQFRSQRCHAPKEDDLAQTKENARTAVFMPSEREALGELFQAGLIDTFRALHPDWVAYAWSHQVTRVGERNVARRLDSPLIRPICCRAARG